MIITRMRKLSSSLKLSLWHLVMYQSSDRICCIHYWLLPIEFKDKDGLPVICYQTYIASPKLHDKVILGRPFFKDNLDHVADLSYVKQWIYFDERPIPWVKIVLEKYSQSRPDTTSPYPHNQSLVDFEASSHARLYCGDFGIFTLRKRYSNQIKVLRNECG